MEALEYIKKYKMDQENYRFNRNNFLVEIGNEFINYIDDVSKYNVDPDTKKLPYYKFREAIKVFESKFNSIQSICTTYNMKGLWKAFYALYVVPRRIDMYPDRQIKICKMKDRREHNNVTKPRKKS